MTGLIDTACTTWDTPGRRLRSRPGLWDAAALRRSSRPSFLWRPGTFPLICRCAIHPALSVRPSRSWAATRRVQALAGGGTELERIRNGDQRVQAAGLSLGQDLAGNACVAFSMIGDIERAVRAHGDRGYRYVHFEAGAIGHRMYLAAEALGLGATGIGSFYDDEVHRYLNLGPEQGQVVYHFAIGSPVPDPRLEG